MMCGGMCGGTGGEKVANEEIQKMVDNVKGHAEAKLDTTFVKFTALHFATQLVSGTNYFIKVDAGRDDGHVHLYVYKKLPCNRGPDEPEYSLEKVKVASHDQPAGYF